MCDCTVPDVCKLDATPKFPWFGNWYFGKEENIPDRFAKELDEDFWDKLLSSNYLEVVK